MRAPTDSRSDEDLVEDHLDGDQGAYEILINRYHDDIFRFVRRMVNDDAAAEDVFQDAFIQAYESLHTFDITRRFRPWLFTIAANKARDALRKKVRRREYSLDAPIRSSADSSGSSYIDLLDSQAINTAHDIDTIERRKLIDAAMETLTPRQREVLLLAYYQRLAYQEIAQMFSIPVGTVKSRLHSAVSAFARAINQQLNAKGLTNNDAAG